MIAAILIAIGALGTADIPPDPEPSAYQMLVDSDGNVLVDSDGNVLVMMT